MKINKSIFKKVAIAMSLVIAMGAANLAFHETTVKGAVITTPVVDVDVDGNDPWGLTFTSNDGTTATIAGYTTPPTGDLIIPETVSDGTTTYTVVAIKEGGIANNSQQYPSSSFYGVKGITSVSLPDTMISLADSSFAACTNLKSINIPDSMQSIGNETFYYSGLESFDFNNIVSVGKFALSGTKLESVEIPESLTTYGMGLFNYCTNLKNVTILANWPEIKPLTFLNCYKLEEINFSYDYTTISKLAFASNRSLDNFTFPNILEHIGESAFSDTSLINSITIPDSILTIDKEAFMGFVGDVYVNSEILQGEILKPSIFRSSTTVNLYTDVNLSYYDVVDSLMYYNYTLNAPITFELNSGTKFEEDYENSDTPVKFYDKIAKAGESIIAPSATRAGFKFNGWYSDSAATKKVADAGTLILNKEIPSTLYAGWESIPTTKFYDVTFNTDGASVAIPMQSVKEGELANKPEPDPTKEGFSFVYWMDEFDNEFIFKENPINENKFLKAKWVSNYDVTFDTDGANEVIPKQSVKEDDFANKPDPDPTKEGFRFVHWMDAESIEFDFEKTPITENITLKAKWISNTAPIISFEVVDNEVGKTLTWEEFVEKQSITAVDKDENPVEVTSEDFDTIDFNTIGEYGITLIAVDKDGNETKEPFTAKVTDTEAPVITTSTTTLEVEIERPILYNTLLADIGAVITDNYDKNLPINNDGFDAIDFSTLGDYTVQLIGQDLSGNIANSVLVTVTVSEFIETPPTPPTTPTNNEEGTEDTQIIVPETVPLSATTVNLGDRTVTAEQTADDENVYLIVDEDGTPLGTVEVVPPLTIEDINIEENMTPLSAPIMKKNPETSGNTSGAAIIILFGALAIASLGLRKKSIKN